MRWVALAACMLLAGCGAAPNPGPAAKSAPDHGFATTNLPEIHLALHGEGAVSYAFGLEFGGKQKCEVATGLAGHLQMGKHALILLETPQGKGWFFFHSAETGLHYGGSEGGVDTRAILDGEGRGGLLLVSNDIVSGAWNITVVADFDGAGNILTGNASATLDVRCERGFDLAFAREAHGHVLSDGDDLSGGIGVAGGSWATLVKGDSTAFSSNGTTRVLAQGFGYQYAELKVDHPSGSTTWTMPSTAANVGGLENFSLEDAAGAYAVTLDRAGVYLPALWIGIWPLGDALDVASVALDHQAYQDPFA